MVIIKVTRSQRSDLLHALKLWLWLSKYANLTVKCRKDLEDLLNLVDCAGEDYKPA